MLTIHSIYHDYEESSCTEIQVLVSMIGPTLVLTVRYSVLAKPSILNRFPCLDTEICHYIHH
jgi:hypothetical protein